VDTLHIICIFVVGSVDFAEVYFKKQDNIVHMLFLHVKLLLFLIAGNIFI